MAFRLYYGWLILAASMVCELLIMGATSYAAGLFVLPLQAEFHVSRAVANSAVLFLLLGTALTAPAVGRALDRFPVRIVMPVAALIFCGGLVVISMISSLWVMALILLLPGAIGFAALGPLNTSTLAARWFGRRRGLALGIAAVATSGGALVVTPRLARAIQDHGWRTALLYEALIIGAIIVALALLVLRDRPADMGLQTHPENQDRPDAPPPPVSMPWRAILSRRDFWIPSLTLIASSGLSQAIVTTLPPYGAQVGLAHVQQAQLISVFGLAAAATKILAGLLADRVKPRALLVASCLLMIASQVMLWQMPDFTGLTAGAALAGASLGFALPTTGRMLAVSFGASHFGAVMGWCYAGLSVSSIVATIFIGHVYDVSHGYGAAFVTFLVATALALGVAALLKPDSR